LTLRYNNKLFRVFKDLVFITKLSIFTTTSCKKIQKKQKKHNKLIVFFATFSMLINSTTSKFQKKNLKSLTINKKRQIEVLILTNAFVQNRLTLCFYYCR
jgi:hypothetical protein